MPLQFLTVVVAVSIALFGLLYAGRERYVHGFRVFDINFCGQMKLMKSITDPNISHAHKEIAKLWLQRSEDYRGGASYFTFSSVHMILAVYMFIIAFFTDYILKDYYFILPFLLGIMFSFFAIFSILVIYRKDAYSYLETGSLSRRICLGFENFSLRLSLLFPPLMPPLRLDHLVRWHEIQQEINNDKDIENFLSALPANKAMKRFKI